MQTLNGRTCVFAGASGGDGVAGVNPFSITIVCAGSFFGTACFVYFLR